MWDRNLGCKCVLAVLFVTSCAIGPAHSFVRPVNAIKFSGRCKPNMEKLSLRSSSKVPQQGQKSKVIVVGGGVGGIAVAGRLARARPDWDILVLEKNKHVGGRLDELSFNGFRFDTGPSLLLAKDVYEDTFQALGSNLYNHVQLRRVEPAYMCFLADNSNVSLTADLHRMQEQLESLEQGSFSKYLEYMRESCINYVKGFSSRPFQSKDNSLLDYINLENLGLLADFDPSNLFMSHEQRLKRFFADPRLHQLLSFQDLYIGLPPHRAPAIFSLLQHLEIVEGVWYPVGGFQRLMLEMQQLVEHAGVTIRTETSVARIVLDPSSQRARGVELASGDLLEADLVVSNVDLPATYAHLLPSDAPCLQGKAEQLAQFQYSSGIIAFYWSLSRTIPQLAHHTTFISPGGKEAWNTIFAGSAEIPEEPSFYVCCTAKTDASAAPAGKECVMVLVPCGCMPEDAAHPGLYQHATSVARQAVFKRLRSVGIDVETDIENEVVYTPADWRSMYGVFRGAAFGLAHPISQLVRFRPPNRDASLKNVYFVGASTSPGNGVPLVLTGARMLSQRILAEHR